jgi:protein-S-isoprenylcysteine O-methyltransferase Ste14
VCVVLCFPTVGVAVCSAAVAVLIVTRTALEDRMLQNGLPGYKEYAARTKYRVIPGIW